MMHIARSYKAYAFFGLALTWLFLFMPKTPVNRCVSHLRLFTMSVHHSCDSPSLAEWAADPQHVFEDYTWRARPFYLLSTSLAASIMSPIAVILDRSLLDHIEIIAQTRDKADTILTVIQRYAPHYVGMIMLNVIILLAAWLIMMSLLNMRRVIGRWAVILALVASPITQAWFWIPTQPMMNLLVPIGAVAAFAWSPVLIHSGYRRIFGLGFGLGLLVLYYAYTAIWGAALIFGWLWSRRQKRSSYSWSQEAKALIIFLIACIMPLVFWFGLFLIQGITQLSSAAETYRQFVWILDALETNTFFEAVELKMYTLMNRLWIVLWPWMLMALLGISALLFLRAYHPSPIKRDHLFIWREIVNDNVIIGAVACIFIMLIFQALQGLYAVRSLYPVLIALIIFLARLGHLFRMERVASIVIIVWSGLDFINSFLVPTDAFE